MAQITAALVKQLRESTGAGMMDAKKALEENDGDMEAATDWLRKKGIAKAAKKSSRSASDGLVAIAVEGTKGAAIELNSETDFVARNEEFQSFVKKVAQAALKASSLEDLKAQKLDTGKSVEESLTDLIAKIGENMTLRRFESVSVPKGAVIAYMHNELAPNLGKIGVLIALESEAPADALQGVGKQVAMHVAAASPECLDQASVDPAKLQREKDILSEQARGSGKPEDIIAKMVEGRIRKYFEEICLLDQIFVIDQERKISKVIEDAGKEAGKPVKLAAYARLQLGEGVSQAEEENLAA
ncbi:MAG: elongation factor Ts [Rhodospirillales bacterium]|nr:elongation factor Ts [Alphaproteobacteria bacterium]MCB1839726.1 elongation factor Ts [Alphaproteobacteria bacterium]MCB9977441.1 elongation factor Ts [Rhodospirillales bacterium]